MSLRWNFWSALSTRAPKNLKMHTLVISRPLCALQTRIRHVDSQFGWPITRSKCPMSDKAGVITRGWLIALCSVLSLSAVLITGFYFSEKPSPSREHLNTLVGELHASPAWYYHWIDRKTDVSSILILGKPSWIPRSIAK